MEICKAFDLFEMILSVIAIIACIVGVIGSIGLLIHSIFAQYKHGGIKSFSPTISKPSIPSQKDMIKGILDTLIFIIGCSLFVACVVGVLIAYKYIKSMFC